MGYNLNVQKCAVIGSSAFGFSTAMGLLSDINLPPESCIIHIPHINAQESYDHLVNLDRPVQRITDENIIKPGYIYIGVQIDNPSGHLVPGDYGLGRELIITRNGNGECVFNIGDICDYYIDYAFRSVAKVFNSSTIGIILMGCESDGSNGVRYIKQQNGTTLVENWEDSPFLSKIGHNNMPKNAVETGMVDEVLPQNELRSRLERLLSTN